MVRILCWVAFVGTVLLVAVLCFAYLDAAVALDDARQEVHYQQQRIETLRGILNDVSKEVDRATIVRLVERRADSSHVIKKGAESISLDEIVFVFDGDKVSGVRLFESGGAAIPRTSPKR
jgi:hypothetical protein